MYSVISVFKPSLMRYTVYNNLQTHRQYKPHQWRVNPHVQYVPHTHIHTHTYTVLLGWLETQSNIVCS